MAKPLLRCAERRTDGGGDQHDAGRYADKGKEDPHSGEKAAFSIYFAGRNNQKSLRRFAGKMVVEKHGFLASK